MEKLLNQRGFTLVEIIVGMAIIMIGVAALLQTQTFFFKKTKDVEIGHAALIEATAKIGLMQSYDFLRLEEICDEWATIGGQTQARCVPEINANNSAHPFLYRWYKPDRQNTKICLELTKCQKMAGGKLYEVSIKLHAKNRGAIQTSQLSFRKPK